jgi:hypothetical protein
MRKYIIIYFGIIFFLLIQLPTFAAFEKGDLVMCPGNDYLWVTQLRPTKLVKYSTSTLLPVLEVDSIGIPAGIGINLSENHLYTVENSDQLNQSLLVCRDISTGLANVAPFQMENIACDVLCHSNGYNYVTSQSRTESGYIQRFGYMNGEIAAFESITAPEIPEAMCESPANQMIYVSGMRARAAQVGSQTQIYSTLFKYTPNPLLYANTSIVGLQPIDLHASNDILFIDNAGLSIVDPGYEDLIRSLTLYNMNSSSTIFEWYTYPDVIRGSCFDEPFNKWLGFRSNPNSMECNSDLYVIDNPYNPSPRLIAGYDDLLITRMLCIPTVDLKFVDLYGINAYNWQIWHETVNVNAPPVATFGIQPGSGPAPLLVEVRNYSFDVDGTVESVFVDWGDNTYQFIDHNDPEFLQFYHTYNNSATYTMLLIVTDNLGDSSTQLQVVEVY